MFYFFSEIVPVGMFLSIVVIFGISFSLRSLNAFHGFFSQVVDIFSEDLTLFEVHKVNPIVRGLKSGHLKYGILNFNFISILSFCCGKEQQVRIS